MNEQCDVRASACSVLVSQQGSDKGLGWDLVGLEAEAPVVVQARS